MGHQESLYRLRGVIELDGALVGGKRAENRGRAAGKTPIIAVCDIMKAIPALLPFSR